MWFHFQGVPRSYLRLASPHRRSDRVSRGRMVPFPCRVDWSSRHVLFTSGLHAGAGDEDVERTTSVCRVASAWECAGEIQVSLRKRPTADLEGSQGAT